MTHFIYRILLTIEQPFSIRINTTVPVVLWNSNWILVIFSN